MRSRPASPADRGGFTPHGLTLIELLIAVAIIGLAFTALAFSQVTGFRITRSAQETAIARDLASAQMERIRGFGFDSYSGCDSATPVDPPAVFGAPACTGSETSSEHAGYGVAWTVTTEPAEITAALSMPALIGVQVDITWPGDSYTLYSYLSCGEAGDFSSTNVPCPEESLR